MTSIQKKKKICIYITDFFHLINYLQNTHINLKQKNFFGERNLWWPF